MIVCLGWGSLIWNCDGLPVKQLEGDSPDVPAWARCAKGQGGEVGDWNPDGPPVQVEFVRQSGCRACGNGCPLGPLTLVLYPSAKSVPSLWARMTVDTPDEAVRALTRRECPGIAENKIKHWSKTNIGQWSRGKADPPDIPGLKDWATSSREEDIEHVIWTALGPKFKGDDTAPTENQAIEYLSDLSGDHRCRAKKYVQCAPPQIKTAYRRRIEHCLQWIPCA